MYGVRVHLVLRKFHEDEGPVGGKSCSVGGQCDDRKCDCTLWDVLLDGAPISSPTYVSQVAKAGIDCILREFGRNSLPVAIATFRPSWPIVVLPYDWAVRCHYLVLPFVYSIRTGICLERVSSVDGRIGWRLEATSFISSPRSQLKALGYVPY